MSPLDRRERDLVKCEDMRIYAERSKEFLGSRSLADFQADDLLQAAVIRCVEVIGEAARLITEDTRLRDPEIPWQLIIGMRNVLAHDYGAVDVGKVYRVVTEHVPELIVRLKILIATLEKEVNWTDDDSM